MVAQPSSQRNPGRWFLILLLVAIGAFLSYIPLSKHALDRHPIHAVEAVRCYDQNGATFEMFNKKDNRTAIVCNDPKNPTAWYIIIVCSVTGCCISAFRRERAKKRNEVEDYLRQTGFNHKRGKV